MGEYVKTMSEEEFQKELEKVRKILEENKQRGGTRYERIFCVIGRITSRSAEVYLPEQLGRLFDLAE